MAKSGILGEIGGRNQGRLAVVYSRIATTRPVSPVISLNVEERLCRRWARDNSFYIVEYIRDVSCGPTINPPGLQRLRELLNEQNIDLVLAYSPDRVSGKQDDLIELLAELDQAGASLEFVVDHSTSKDTRYP